MYGNGNRALNNIELDLKSTLKYIFFMHENNLFFALFLTPSQSEVEANSTVTTVNNTLIPYAAN